MANIKLYTIIFGALMGISTVQFVLEFWVLDEAYVFAGTAIMVLSTIKAVAVAGWYMHMIEEPRSITYLAMAGVLCVVALTAGAGYSIM